MTKPGCRESGRSFSVGKLALASFGTRGRCGPGTPSSYFLSGLLEPSSIPSSTLGAWQSRLSEVTVFPAEQWVQEGGIPPWFLFSAGQQPASGRQAHRLTSWCP